MFKHYMIWACVLVISLAACTAKEVQQGEELAVQGNWDGAVIAYREALRQDPFNKDLEEKYRYAKERAAEQHFIRGQKFLTDGRLAEALQEFEISLGYNPSHQEYHTALTDAWRLKSSRQSLVDAKQMESLGRLDEALALYETSVELDPSLTEAVEGITRVVHQQQEEQKIGGTAEPVTLRFQNTRLKQVFEILARTANIDIVFDKDVRDDLVTVFTKDTPFDEALNLILTTNQLFSKRVGPNRLLIAPDTKQKREQYEDLQIRTFYLTNSKAKDMANLLRTILETKRVYVNEPLNTVVIRDLPPKLHLAEQVILANDRQDSEVVFEVEVLEVTHAQNQELGVNFAKQLGFGAFPPGTEIFNTLPQTWTYKELTSINQDSYLFSLPSSILLNFFKQESDAKLLANPQIRVLNNQKASINIGDKQPILLSTTNVLPGQAATGAVPTTSTVTSIEFKDTGIKLTVEPTVHLTNSITLRLQIEITRLGDRVILQTDPLISQFRFGTRTADTALNMRDGETVVLAGLISEDDRQTREGVAGVDEIPGLGDLLSNTEKEKVKTEIMLVITPHIVRNVNLPKLAKRTMWSGTAKGYGTKPLFSDKKKTVSTPFETPEDNAQPNTQDPLPEANTPQAPQDSQSKPQDDNEPPTTNPTEVSRIQVIPAAASIRVGEDISLTLQGQNFSAVEQSTLVLNYDPAVMTFKQAVEGAFWTGQQITPSLTVSAIPQTGQLIIQMGQQGKPAQGSGPLATITFEATGPGTSNIQIQNPTVLGANSKPVPVMVQHGRVWVE